MQYLPQSSDVAPTRDCTNNKACVAQKNRKLASFFPFRLGNNNITAEGAKQLAEGLKSNKSLQFLG